MNTKNTATKFSSELLTEIGQKLHANELVRYQLPEGGRLHIDRQLPFLVVHRRRAGASDIGTKRLLLGEAAYLQTSASAELQQPVKELVHMIAVTQAQKYGAFLVLEIWSRDIEPLTDPATTPAPGFHIYAPEHEVPYQTLQTLEHALSSITLRGKAADVKISYQQCPSPPDLPALFDDQEINKGKIILFGMEVDAVYRDPETESILSYALKKIHHGLAVAMKKAFFTFSHDCTSFKPEHYHVLGRRSMTDSVREVDAQLADVSDDFDLLLHVTPVNSHDAWEQFQQSNYQQVPEFHYRPRTADPAILKRKLYTAPIERIEDPALANFFSSKREELDQQISLLSDRGTSKFIYSSMLLYGAIDDPLMQLAKMILAYPVTESKAEKVTLLDAEQLAAHAREEVDYYRTIDTGMSCSVEVRDDIAGILVSHGNFLISTDARITQQRLRATLSHEIGTHAVTHYNGRQQPFQQLYAGMAGYEELQEGLAVLSEYLVGGLDMGRMRLLAARVLAADSVIRGDNFVETFNLLHSDYDFTPYMAFLISLRVHRGGGYTKDMVYLRGFSQLLDYLKTSDDIDILYTGKVSLKFLPLIKELMWREVITPSAIIPRYLMQVESRKRLDELMKTPDMETILRSI